MCLEGFRLFPLSVVWEIYNKNGFSDKYLYANRLIFEKMEFQSGQKEVCLGWNLLIF